MGITELIKAVMESNVGVNVNIEGKEAVKVSAEGSTINIDIVDPVPLSKILSSLK